MISRNRIHSKYIVYALYFYFSGLSLRKAGDIGLSAIALSKEIMFPFGTEIQKYNPQKISTKKKKISEYLYT